MRPTSPARLFALSVASSGAYAGLSVLVSRRGMRRIDDRVRDAIQYGRHPAGDRVATALGPLGKEWLHLPATLLLAAALPQHARTSARTVPVLASVAAELLSRTLEWVPPTTAPPPGHPNPRNPSYPSGHALETGAVALATAYVLAREQLVAPAPAFGTAAVLTMLSAGGKLYLDRHWISDVLGGALAAVAIAAGAAGSYERARRRAEFS